MDLPLLRASPRPMLTKLAQFVLHAGGDLLEPRRWMNQAVVMSSQGCGATSTNTSKSARLAVYRDIHAQRLRRCS